MIHDHARGHGVNFPLTLPRSGCNRNMLPETDEDQEVFDHEKSVKEDDALSQDRRADELCTKNRKHKNKVSHYYN